MVKKTIHELAQEFPEKTYKELEKYRDADRQQEAQQILIKQENEELKEDQQKQTEGEEQDDPTLWEIAKEHNINYADAVPIQEDMRLKRDALKEACTLAEMRKDRSPLAKMKKRAQEAETELSLIKGINRNEIKELEKKITDLYDKDYENQKEICELRHDNRRLAHEIEDRVNKMRKAGII